VLCSSWKKSMAGSAPEGTQFDARQYDAKMDSMYVQLFLAVPHVFSISASTLKAWLTFHKKLDSLLCTNLEGWKCSRDGGLRSFMCCMFWHSFCMVICLWNATFAQSFTSLSDWHMMKNFFIMCIVQFMCLVWCYCKRWSVLDKWGSLRGRSMAH